MIRGAAAGALLVLASSCTLSEPRGVVLVTLDTTRADRLGCYGYAGAKTPHLDALAAEGARFAAAGTAVTTTLASHATMFTGQYPPAHGVRYNGMFKVAPETKTVAEVLRGAGWATAAVPAAFPVTRKTGLDKGFDVYLDLFTEPGGEKLPMRAERKAADVVSLATKWLDGVGEKRFFLWVHVFDPHWPYEPPFPFSAEFRDRGYDGEIAYADRELGKLFDALRVKGLWGKTLVVVAGDHGEGLFEHGERQHGHLVYESTLHVPLIVKPPGKARASVVEEPVTLADLAPTILDYARAPVPAGLHGVSLRGAIEGKPIARRDLYFETLTGSLNYGWSPLEGLRRGKWKLIRSSAPELYDLDADPKEAANVVAREAQLADDLGARLDADLASWTDAAPDAGATLAAPDPETLARLASLGYVGGAMGSEARGGPPPVSKIHLEPELLQLRDLAAERLWAEAIASARRILADDPGNRFALHQGAAAAATLGDRDARTWAAELVRRYPEYTPGVVLAGELEMARKDYGAAIAIFRRGLERHPDEPTLVYPLALSLIATGGREEAAALVERALASPSPPVPFYLVRAILRAKAGEGDRALADLREALARGYRDLETLRTEPMLAPLRAVPGFDDMLRTVASE